MIKYPIIDLGNFPIYKLLGGCGLVLGLLLLIHNLKDFYVGETEKDRFLLLLAISFLAGMGFSNVGNWFVMPGLLELPFLQRVQNAGLSYYFGFIGFLTVSVILLTLYKYPVTDCLNRVIPSLLLFHAFGRIGCSLAGCCYGKIVNWNVMGFFVIDRFPAREIEAFCLFIMFLATQFFFRKHRLVFYLYTYPIIRFFLEFGRGDYRGVLITSVLSPAQIISILIVMITSMYLLIRCVFPKKKHTNGGLPEQSAITG